MRYLCLILSMTALAVPQESRQSNQAMLVAEGLSWYSVWMSPERNVSRRQSCQGALRGRFFRLKCDPLAVVVDGMVDSSGRCSISFMRPSFDTEENLTPPVSGGEHREVLRCEELPAKDGAFSLKVDLKPRQMDKTLTLQARDQALACNKRSNSPCLLHFPRVSQGDPFFHVYQECDGALEAVWEFPIRSGRAQDYAHWVYTRRRDSLPDDAEKRIANRNLWFDSTKVARKAAR